MIKGSLRTMVLGAVVSAGLVASAGTAQAVEYNFGGLKMQLDTTVSVGASMRVASTNSKYLPTSNGGPLQATFGTANNCAPGFFFVAAPAVSTADCHLPAVATDGVVAAPPHVAALNVIQAPDSLSGSINTDDGRLNFDRGDLTSGVVKMTNDLSGSFQNYKFFARLSSYYDAVLANGSSYNRSELVDGEADAARDIKLLDFYGSADYNIGDLPLNIRAGKQVISWGEGTFIQNGINVINPIDVSAFRRPGSELKEGFIPVWALDASIGLPYNLSIEAFYQLKWDTYALDRPGTPFSGSDVTAYGSGVGGNENARSFLTGSPGGNIMRNCSNPNPINDVFNAIDAANPLKDCAGAALDYTLYNSTVAGLGGWSVGDTERIRFAYGDTSIVQRDQDRDPSDSGQWGVATRWYSEDLGNTEFGLYFTNYHSRLPIASERVKVSPTTSTYQSYLSTGATSSQTTRLLGYTGCNLPSGAGAASAVIQPAANYGVPVGLTAAQVAQMNQAGTAANDPSGVYTAALALADAFYAGGSPNYTIINQPVGSPFAAGIRGTNLGGGLIVQAYSALEASIVNCALIAMQSTQLAPGTPVMLADGAQIMLASDSNDPALGLYLEYPEDIHMVGASFNTTIGTWGLQGEATYRSNAPMQLDTDQLTITALNKTCLFELLLGAGAYNALIPSSLGLANPDTFGGKCGQLGVGNQQQDLHGYVRSKMFTAQVGTTATYSNSNALINGLGADLGILVTEVGMVYTPDAPSPTGATLRWGNVCTQGTDLPLGGFLSLASRSGCRPTATSWGYTLLGQLQYNNAFGTAITLSPTMAFSHDVSGNTAAPYSNYRQGRKSASLQLNGSYQGAWKGGISYTNYFGNEKYTGNDDGDFASVNLSYAF